MRTEGDEMAESREDEQKGFSKEYRVFLSVSVTEYPSTAKSDTNEMGEE
jgi:hypothetical protein